MYVYTVVIISVLALVSTRNLQSRNDVSYKHLHHHTQPDKAPADQGNKLSPGTIKDGGELSPDTIKDGGDRCGAVALRCYEPILSYIDNDGGFCGWKDMTSFRELPQICMDMEQLSWTKWGDNVIKYNYKFYKTCDKTQSFQHCVANNQVCRRDTEMGLVIAEQNIFCDNIEAILPVVTCMNAWDRSDNWWMLVYTYGTIVQACPAIHYRQLTLNAVKLSLFTYITYPSSWIDGVAESLNAEAAGRHICQLMEQRLCLYQRRDTLCTGYLPMFASQNFNDKQLINLCQASASNVGKCNAFVKMNCTLNVDSGHVTVKMDLPDIRSVYNISYWHAVSNSEVDILLHTDNKGIGHCDSGNLVFKQIGCFHQYITQIDINNANEGNYLTEYICSNINIYNSCFEAYINSSCPDEADQFQGITSFLHSQCDILRVVNRNATCPLLAVYSNAMFKGVSWYTLIMALMQRYITVMTYTQRDPAPVDWRDVALANTDLSIIYYSALLIEGEKFYASAYYEADVISTVCDQETADVYNDFVTLSTGEQFYKFVNHIIKGFEYIRYLVEENG